MRLILLVLAIVVALADTADARWRLRRNRSSGGYSTGYAAASLYASPQEAALAKATILANAGRGWHPGGGYGGGSREGWGFSRHSARAAQRSTCWGGACDSAIGSAQVWSPRAGGWFAINIW